MSLTLGKTPSRRQMEIVDWLREKGRVTVEDLATHFTVTPQTIRRDLNDLSDAQMVVRVHGGAMVSSGVVNLAYDARKMLAGPHKKLTERCSISISARSRPPGPSSSMRAGSYS